MCLRFAWVFLPAFLLALPALADDSTDKRSIEIIRYDCVTDAQGFITYGGGPSGTSEHPGEKTRRLRRRIGPVRIEAMTRVGYRLTPHAD